MLARYLLFGGKCYYPRGGWDDLLCDMESLEDARVAAEYAFDAILGGLKADGAWVWIVDTHTKQVISVKVSE